MQVGDPKLAAWGVSLSAMSSVEGLMGCPACEGFCSSGAKPPVYLSCSDLLCSIAKSIYLVYCEVRTINLYQKRIRMNPVLIVR